MTDTRWLRDAVTVSVTWGSTRKPPSLRAFSTRRAAASADSPAIGTGPARGTVIVPSSAPPSTLSMSGWPNTCNVTESPAPSAVSGLTTAPTGVAGLGAGIGGAAGCAARQSTACNDSRVKIDRNRGFCLESTLGPRKWLGGKAQRTKLSYFSYKNATESRPATVDGVTSGPQL